MEPLHVRSHVARDLLQSADLFKTDRTVIWEYVSNGLQYVDPGTRPQVNVSIDAKKHYISIEDNGRGMLWSDLKNFFIMHGENIDRRQGRPGRGNFGTGKSAAFGIAQGLRITTTRNGKRSCVELRRKDIETMSSEDPIPVSVNERESRVSQSNGTLVEILDVHLRSIDQAGVIRFIERHLLRWPKDVTVFVNGHECQFIEPPIEREEICVPDEETARVLGNVRLTIRVSKSPLEEDLRGISIFANGVWCETTLAGSEGREMSHYILGEIDIPRLDEYKGPIRPIDMSRSMKLNPSNPLVQCAYAFIGENVERIRRELVKRERVRRADEEVRRLQSEAEKIAQVINEDFDQFRKRLRRMRSTTVGSADNSNALSGNGEVELLKSGGNVSGVTVKAFTPTEHTNGRTTGSTAPEQSVLIKTEDGPPAGASYDRTQGVRTSRAGGFQVRFGNLGAEEHRAKYLRDERTIFINLDHPQIQAARGQADHQDASFRRLAYEVAFAEYAVALASEHAIADEYLDFTDPIFEIRETLNRLATKGASLYAVVTD